MAERSSFVPTPPPSHTLSRSSGQTYPVPSTNELAPAAGPTPEEFRRWNAEPVTKFRRKLAPYLFVNGVIVIATMFGDGDLFGITVLWSIWMAFKYAKLWADGYDWRDVFRQPRDRDLIDVADDFLTYIRAMFNRTQRQQLREQRRARVTQRQSGPAALPHSFGTQDAAGRPSGSYAERVRRAEMDRDEIIRLLDRMPAGERSRIPDVGRSAEALCDRVKHLALAMSDLERAGAASGADQIEAEIARLENDANPLDERASDERVRRLAFLKRQRRAVADVSSKRDAVAAKLETCMVALENIKFDLIRLNAGSQTPQHITNLAMDALNLADSVDAALFVEDSRSGGNRPASRQAAR
jgi:serine/threonine-protein kinase